LKVFDFGEDTTSAFFVDSGLSYSGSATTTLSGLYHLEGETLQVLGNGATHPDETVSGGGITLGLFFNDCGGGLWLRQHICRRCALKADLLTAQAKASQSAFMQSRCGFMKLLVLRWATMR
jgi:hypothetical protein